MKIRIKQSALWSGMNRNMWCGNQLQKFLIHIKITHFSGILVLHRKNSMKEDG